MNESLHRIIVIGTTGSGKTTFAAAIGERLDCPHIELDALHWEANWVEAPDKIFRERVREAISIDRWVVDGNYSAVRDITWPRATMLVWLDYPFLLVAYRLFIRSLRRAFTQEELWQGNRERVGTWFTKDSLFLWFLQTYWRRKHEYPQLFAQSQHGHLTIIQLRSPREAARWLDV